MDNKQETNIEELIRASINEYAEKYCKKHHVSMEEAKNHMSVKLIEEYYKDNPPKDFSVRTELDIGCKGGC